MAHQLNGQVNGVSDSAQPIEPAEVLRGASQVKGLTQTLFSRDVDAAPKQTNSFWDAPSQLWQVVLSQLGRLPEDAKLALDTIKTKLGGGLVNDKEYDLEGVIQVAASLPPGNRYLQQLGDTLVGKLWTDLQHPPISYLGDEWRYRTMNGSNNNRLYPWLGQAGSPYARSVRPRRELTPNLPDSGLLFDQLFARGATTKEHPTRTSSMLFYMATIIIHDCFRTNSADWEKVDNSSYLDLSPLYGNADVYDSSDPAKDKELQVRTFENGLLKPDAYWEPRLLGFPPGVSCILIMFNRFHNSVATQLAAINEGGRFTLKTPDQLTSAEARKYGATPEGAKLKRDNDLFQVARLITCGLYINIILVDYVRTILNLQKTNSSWYLDPRENPDWLVGPKGVPEGLGNQVSVEFNLVYRWHSTVSPRDADWTKGLMAKMFPGKDPTTLSIKDLRTGLRDYFHKNVPADPGKRVFEQGVNRQPNGYFKDEDLVDLLTKSTEDVAGAFGAHQVPPVLKVIEMLGIEQARKWNCATLNEFRKYFGLQPHSTFLDINSDPSVAETLKTFYGDPDNVELYPGLVLEDPKKPMTPGAGLCPGFTISRAILSDATALVRGDRFYTVDFNAASLTNWGYNFVQPDPTINGGGVIFKLFQRAFPGWYRSKSIYANYPFTEPKEMQAAFTKLKRQGEYSYDRPSFVGPPTPVLTWKGCASVLEDQKNFRVPWGPHIKDITSSNYECILGSDAPPMAKKRLQIQKAIYPSDWKAQVKELYRVTTTNLLKERRRSLGHGVWQIDAVADIANMSHAIAVAQLFDIPIQLPKDVSDTTLTAEQYYAITAALFAYVFLDIDTASSMKLTQVAKQSSKVLSKIVEQSVQRAHGSIFGTLKEWLGHGVRNNDIARDFGKALVKRFLELSDGDVHQATWELMSTMTASVATQAQGLSQILDLLFTDEYAKDWASIKELAASDDPAAFEKLRRYAMETLRLGSPAFGLPRVVAADATIQDGPRSVAVKAGGLVFTDLVTANLDPERFPDPKKIKLDRPDDTYITQGWGPHSCLGRQITIESIATQLQVLGRLKNLRRAPGPSGQLKYVTVQGTIKVFMQPDWSDFWPLPTTMKFLYDE